MKTSTNTTATCGTGVSEICSTLLDSVLEHVRRLFCQLFYDQRREKSAPWFAGFGLGLRT